MLGVWGSMWKCTEADQSSYSQHRGSRGEIQKPVVGRVGFLLRPAFSPPGAEVFLGSLPWKPHWACVHLPL